jgi:hypothetical protein
VGAQMRSAVRDVAKHFPTAIVSGRCRDKVHCLRHLSRRRKHSTRSHMLINLAFFFLLLRCRCAISSVSRSSTTPAAMAWTSRDQAPMYARSTPHRHLNSLGPPSPSLWLIVVHFLIRICSPSRSCANLQASSSP